MINTGLKPATINRKYHQRFSLHRTFGSTTDTIPDEWEVPEIQPARNQGPTLLCSAYTVSEILADHYKTPMSEDYQASMTNYLTGGKIELEGAELYEAMKVAIPYGALPTGQAPYRWEVDGVNTVCNPNTYIPFIDQAKVNNEISIFKVDGPGDTFDNIISALWQHKKTIAVGTPWYAEWNSVKSDGIIPNKFSRINGWHAYVIKCPKMINGVQYLKAREWEGAGFGDNSYVYFDRETVNKAFTVPGSEVLMYYDIDPNIIKNNQIQSASILEIINELVNRLKHAMGIA